MERNADTILEEIGIDFREDPEALDDLEGGRSGCAGRARAFSPRHVPHPDPADERRESSPSMRATPHVA